MSIIEVRKCAEERREWLLIKNNPDRGDDMYPVFWTPAFELNNYFFIKDASLNLEGGIHFDFAWILLLL